MAFWETTSTIEQTLSALEARRIPDKALYWEDLAAMHYLTQGPEAAVRFLRGLGEDDVDAGSRERATAVLGVRIDAN